MIAAENLYAGDYVHINRKDGQLYQATWEEFKNGTAWRIAFDVRKGQYIPQRANIIYREMRQAS